MPSALNYDSKVTHNDGSCAFAPRGCTDSLAEVRVRVRVRVRVWARARAWVNSNLNLILTKNYDALAVTDSGLCDYKIVGCMDQASFNLLTLTLKPYPYP